MTNRIGQALEQHTESQENKLNEVIDQVNDTSSCSQEDKSILGMIDTSSSGRISIEPTTVMALIASLGANLTKANSPT